MSTFYFPRCLMPNSVSLLLGVEKKKKSSMDTQKKTSLSTEVEMGDHQVRNEISSTAEEPLSYVDYLTIV